MITCSVIPGIYDLSDGYAWNGYPVTVDFAKESFLSRLEKERLDPRNKNILVENKTPNAYSNIKSTSQNHQDEKSANVQVNKKKVFSEHESSEDSESSECDSDEKLTTTSACEKSQTVNAANVKPNNLCKPENSESEDSESSESDSDNTEVPQKPNTTSFKQNSSQQVNKVSQNSSNQRRMVQYKQQSSGSDDSSEGNGDDKEININTVVDHSNDVMKQFEQFSSVWQDSSENEDDHSDSSEEIFEAFKTNPTNKESQGTNCSNNGKQSSFPDHDRSSDFVKTRQPHVQCKMETNTFPEVKISSFSKFQSNNRDKNGFPEVKTWNSIKYESKNKKIVFDTECRLEKTTVGRIPEESMFPRSAQLHEQGKELFFELTILM